VCSSDLDNRNVFELNDKEKNGLVDEIFNLIKKSAGLDFLINTNVQSLFSKDNKKEIFKALKDILVGSNESSEKRNSTAELLVKSQGIWSDISSDDIYDILKQIKRTKNIKTDELKEKQKNILDSWGYSDSSEDIMEL
jgi:serine/threonine protein phosphatase PrpC